MDVSVITALVFSALNVIVVLTAVMVNSVVPVAVKVTVDATVAPFNTENVAPADVPLVYPILTRYVTPTVVTNVLSTPPATAAPLVMTKPELIDSVAELIAVQSCVLVVTSVNRILSAPPMPVVDATVKVVAAAAAATVKVVLTNVSASATSSS